MPIRLLSRLDMVKKKIKEETGESDIPYHKVIDYIVHDFLTK